ncbi:CorA family divalent cation transporter [Novosphingobium resinovorum]|uniref:CorA family divalent cation transporter n=1 Tax=Novosphingobium resinovorum TaxID=158500 RepID=UPI003D28B8B3
MTVHASDKPLTDDESSELPLLFGRVLDGRGGARGGRMEEAQRWKPGVEGEVLWIHLLRTHPGMQEWLEAHCAIPEPTAELLTSDANRPRAFREGQTLVATLRGINFNPGAAPEDMLSLQLWSDGSRVVTLRRAPLQTPRLVADDLDAGSGPHDAGALVTALTEHLIDRMSHAIVDMNAMIDDLEDETADTYTDQTLDKIAMIRRQSLALKRHMSPQHEALTAIANGAPGWFEDHDRREIAESIARLRRYLDDLDISKESAGRAAGRHPRPRGGEQPAHAVRASGGGGGVPAADFHHRLAGDQRRRHSAGGAGIARLLDHRRGLRGDPGRGDRAAQAVEVVLILPVPQEWGGGSAKR